VVASGGEYCDKCKRRNPIAFHVEPEEAWRTVVLNRWRKLCPSCFDVLAEQAGVAYQFFDLEAQPGLRGLRRGGSDEPLVR
jgi:hypothetical protein